MDAILLIAEPSNLKFIFCMVWRTAFQTCSFSERNQDSSMPARLIDVRPSRNPRWQKQGGWEVFESDGVCPVYCDESGPRASALSYPPTAHACSVLKDHIFPVIG